MSMPTPAANGLRMPAEWEQQEAIWLAWPHEKEDWPGKFEPIPWVYADIIRHIAAHQKVRLLVKNARQKEQAQEILNRADANGDNIEFFEISTNRVWLRDSGPIFLTGENGEKAMLDWRFNAWAKYPNHRLDNKVPENIHAHFPALSCIAPRHKGVQVVLEGGSIDVNGSGSILTTEECLLSTVQERNPGFIRDDYEKIFADYLGAPNTIWLQNGIEGDDTHGHVDDLARFVNADTVVIVSERDSSSVNYAPLQENLKRLQNARDERGRQLNIVELPMPRRLVFEKQSLPASYANFLITNALVLVPTFNDAADRIALNTLAELFPTREIVGIHAVDLVWGFGTLHCMSQQEPAV